MSHRRLTLAAAATSLLALNPALAAAQAACANGGDCADDEADLVAPVHLLQTARSLHSGDGAAAAGAPPRSSRGARDLALVHVPWNFGHTIEKVGLLGSNASSPVYERVMVAVSPTPKFWGIPEPRAKLTLQQQQSVVRTAMMPGGEHWGMMQPELAVMSPDTGCPMYFTPQRYWPKDFQARYFGGRKRFGVLRDPYERLVAIFRGSQTADSSYGGDWGNYRETCDVNGAVKMMMKRYLNTTNKFMGGCVFLPQAEYFEGNDYDINLPVDNRLFPDSMNDVFKAHGYSDMLITTRDIMHVAGCNEVWSGDFDAETRGLVRQVYSRDFELICKYFGYCDPNENTCLRLIPQMCPKKVVG